MACLMGKSQLGDPVGNRLAKVDDGHNAGVETLLTATSVCAVSPTHTTLDV